METLQISIPSLIAGLLLMLIPAYLFYKYKTGLLKEMIIALFRMVLQLFLVGFYLRYLFEWNQWWLNIIWLLLMIAVCCLDLGRRTHISQKYLFVPVYLSILMAVFLIASYFLKVVVGMENLFESQYFIPICGILLGNILSSNVIALNAFYGGISREQQLYQYLLGNGASFSEARRPFIREAIIRTFNPSIANMAVMGLIALPGTMVGQLLGGSLPDVSIRYQIMIVVIIFVASCITALSAIYRTSSFAFDEYCLLRKDVLKEVRKNK